jgi:hypothetical protein
VGKGGTNLTELDKIAFNEQRKNIWGKNKNKH